jgi:hypothetical protein
MEFIDLFTFNNLNSLNIINEIKNYSKILKKSHLLNLNKENFDILEKYIYESVQYHCQHNNIILTNELFVEFYFENEDNNISLSKKYKKTKDNEYVYPLINCITYLNEKINPILLTNIDIEKYMYKEFSFEKQISVLYPKINYQIIVDSSKIYKSICTCNINVTHNELKLVVKLWNINPINIEYYVPSSIINYDKNNSIICINKHKLNLKKIDVSNEIINFELFENLFYKNEYECNKKLFEYFESFHLNENESDLIIFNLDEEIEKYNKELKLKNKYGDIYDLIKDVYNNNININNRFLQRLIKEKLYSVDICNWICSEFDKNIVNNKWVQNPKRLNNSVIDVSIEKMPDIFNFVLISLKNINEIIRNFYCLDEKINFNIIELNIVKYNCNISKDYSLSEKNSSFFTFRILLNDITNFEEGEISFDDGIKYKLNQGDFLLNCSKINYYNLPLKKGIKYILVGNVDIEFI